MNAEAVLYAEGGWVSASDLARLLGVSERDLRQTGSKPGLVSGFAVSGDKGYKHVAHASTVEWLAFRHRLWRHIVAEMRRVRTMQKRRREVLVASPRSVFKFEADSGQGVLL